MNEQIEFAVKNERFPLSSGEKVALLIIGIGLVAALIYTNLYYQKLSFLILSTIVAILIATMVYKGITASLYFRPIPTGFTKDQNEKLIKICLKRLNIKVYRDKEYDNLFVCFIHDKNNDGRQEIYLIAKDEKVLINSNKQVNSDEESGRIDFVDKIGTSIYLTAKHFRKIQMKNQQ